MMDILPFLDLGMSIIVFTIIIKLILFPISQKSVVTQAKIKLLEPKLNEIREKYKDKQEQALKTMELYKNEKINPLSGFFLILIQIPIIFALYFIFLKAGFPDVKTEILYPFIDVPNNINMTFLGLFDVSKKSIILAFLAGLSQFFQALLSTPKIQPKKETDGLSADFSRSMSLQMRYVFPVIIFVVAYNVSAAVALYWAVSNIFMIGQELYVKSKMSKQETL
jgi:YidC/Oxa1 family membrane protein insertase